MGATDELRERLENKFILFDTNILIEASKHFDSFEALLILLRESKCDVCYIPLIEFEFTRDAVTTELHVERERFLEKIKGVKLPMHSELFDDALAIARVYAHMRIPPKQISLVDCCIAAYMKKYEKNLFLVTKNHRDFPIEVFNRIFIYPIEVGSDVSTAAIYQFSMEKWSAAISDHRKAVGKGSAKTHKP